MKAKIITKTVNICSNCGAILEKGQIDIPNRWFKTEKYKKWTKDQDDVLTDLVNKGTAIKEIAKIMKRTYSAIKFRRTYLKNKKT